MDKCMKTIRLLEKLIADAATKIEPIAECLEASQREGAGLSKELETITKNHSRLKKAYVAIEAEAKDAQGDLLAVRSELAGTSDKLAALAERFSTLQTTHTKLEMELKTVIKDRDDYREKYMLLRQKLGLVAEELSSDRLVHARSKR